MAGLQGVMWESAAPWGPFATGFDRRKGTMVGKQNGYLEYGKPKAPGKPECQDQRG
jgi:hypothetical protein